MPRISAHLLDLGRPTAGQNRTRHLVMADVAVGHTHELDLVAKHRPTRRRSPRLQLAVVGVGTEDNDPHRGRALLSSALHHRRVRRGSIPHALERSLFPANSQYRRENPSSLILLKHHSHIRVAHLEYPRSDRQKHVRTTRHSRQVEHEVPITPADRRQLRGICIRPRGVTSHKLLQFLRSNRNRLRSIELAHSRLPPLRQLDQPDVAKPHSMAVVLQLDWSAILVPFIRNPLQPVRRAEDRFVVLDHNAIVNHGHPRRFEHTAVTPESRSPEGNVIRLPIPGWPRRIQ